MAFTRGGPFWSAIFGGLMLGAGIACAQGPADEASFTATMAERFAAALPDTRVTIREPLTLGIDGVEPSGSLQVNLDRVWTFCARNSNACGAAISDYVAKTATTIKQMNAPIDSSTIRVVVRPANYVEGIRKQAVGHPEAEPTAAPLAGDIWWVLVADNPQAVRILSAKDLERLKLTKEQALQQAQANVRSVLRPLSAVTRKIPKNGIGTIRGDYYESSRLTLYDDWAALAKTMTGPLIVAAPDPSVVLYSDGGRPHAVEALMKFAREMARKSEKPLSMTVLRWSESGWISIAP